MKQFGVIFRFELMNYLKNKIFVGVTIFLVVLIGIVMFFPGVIAMFNEDGEITSEERPMFNEDGEITSEERPIMLISTEEGDPESVREAFAAAFTDYDVCVADGSLDEIKRQVSSGKADCAFVLNGPTAYTYYVDNLSMYDENTYAADQILQNVYRMNAMVQGGITAEQAGQILSVQIEHEVENLGKDQMQNFFYTYIMIFALYMVILLYGQMVATNVATEKSSRAMEVLITSARPVSMMFGKVIASCVAGFIQLVCVFGSAFLFFQINKSYWGDNAIINSIFDMPVGLLLYMLLFFVLGFLIYAFMYGAVGSTASKLEDINTSVMPITLLFVIAFVVVIFSMTSGNVDNIWMIICSYIPFTSPMAMFTRIAMSTVPWYEIAISVVILIGSVFGIGIFSAKIYRAGVLLYGTTPRIGAVIKSLTNA